MLVLLSLPLAGCLPSEAAGRVTDVTDGDTFTVLLRDHDSRIAEDTIQVRLADIDCPEMDSASGTVPEEFTAKQLKDSLVYLDLDDMNGKDSYGRWVAVVYLSKSDGSLDTGRNFNRMLVDGGQACIWDFDNNEFNPASWWNWSIPSSACVKSESSVGTDIFRSPPWMERDRYSSEGSPQAEDAGHTYSGFNAGGSYYGSAGSSSVGSAGTGSFVGSARSDKYHYPSCEWAQKISPSNEVWFSSPQDARASGYVPCKVCRPP